MAELTSIMGLVQPPMYFNAWPTQPLQWVSSAIFRLFKKALSSLMKQSEYNFQTQKIILIILPSILASSTAVDHSRPNNSLQPIAKCQFLYSWQHHSLFQRTIHALRLSAKWCRPRWQLVSVRLRTICVAGICKMSFTEGNMKHLSEARKKSMS